MSTHMSAHMSTHMSEHTHLLLEEVVCEVRVGDQKEREWDQQQRHGLATAIRVYSTQHCIIRPRF